MRLAPRLAAAALVLLAAAAPGAAAPPRARHAGAERHLLVVVDLAAPPGRIRSARVVPKPLPARAGRRLGWDVVVEDAAGAVLHRTKVAPAGVVRGEFAAPGGGVEAVTVRDPRGAVRLRLPLIPGAAAIRISGAAGEVARVPYPGVAR